MTLTQYIGHLFNKIPLVSFYRAYSGFVNKSNRGIVFTLHRIYRGSESHTGNSFIELNEKKLEQNIVDLKKLGARFVSLEDLESLMNEEISGQPPFVHFSFDDGYLDNYKLAYPLLKKYRIPFSVFVVSEWMNNKQPFLWWYMMDFIIVQKIPVSFEKYEFNITKEEYISKPFDELFQKFRAFLIEKIDQDRLYFQHKLECYLNALYRPPAVMSWDQLNEMIASGLCEAGIHTHNHARFSSLSRDQQSEEIRNCKEQLQHYTGKQPVYFAYPYGAREDIGPANGLEALMKDQGIRLAFTTMTGQLNKQSARWLLPRFFLNDDTTIFSLKTRLNGTYQRGLDNTKK